LELPASGRPSFPEDHVDSLSSEQSIFDELRVSPCKQKTGGWERQSTVGFANCTIGAKMPELASAERHFAQ
jgi:hypothetical protein